MVPGYVLAEDEKLTVAKLNAMALPLARVAPGAVGKRELVPGDVAELVGNIAVQKNYFQDSGFELPWLDPTGTDADEATGEVTNARDWAVLPEVGKVGVDRVASSPPEVRGNKYALRVTGDASATGEVLIGQYVAAARFGALGRRIVVSAWVRNDTGEAFTPQWRVECAAAPDDGALGGSVQVTAAQGGPIGNTQWARVWATFDLDTLADAENGAMVSLVIPAERLDVGSKSVRVAQAMLENGQVPGAYLVPDGTRGAALFLGEVPPPTQANFKAGFRAGDFWFDAVEDQFYCLLDSTPVADPAWRAIAPRRRDLEGLVEYVVAANTAGFTVSNSSWTRAPLGTVRHNDEEVIELDDEEVKVTVAGEYEVSGWAYVVASGARHVQTRLVNVTDSDAVLAVSELGITVSNQGTRVGFQRRVVLEEDDVVRLEVRVTGAGTALLGHSQSVDSMDQVRASLSLRRIGDAPEEED